MVVFGVVAAYVGFYAPKDQLQYLAQFAPPQNQRGQAGGQGGHFGLRGDAPVPVLVAVAKKAEVPVYFDGVGSSPALNTGTVPAPVDGKLMSVNSHNSHNVAHHFAFPALPP